MEKKLVARLNEIGQEIGYPYQVLKNGQYQVFDETANPNDETLPMWEHGYKNKLTMHFNNGECKMQRVNKKILWKNIR